MTETMRIAEAGRAWWESLPYEGAGARAGFCRCHSQRDAAGHCARPLRSGGRLSIPHGQTALGALLVPAWAQDGGRPEMLKRLADPAQRVKIATEVEQAMKARLGSHESVYLPAM